jgi:hypothetical protein
LMLPPDSTRISGSVRSGGEKSRAENEPSRPQKQG